MFHQGDERLRIGKQTNAKKEEISVYEPRERKEVNSVDVERRDVQERSEPSMVAATFIKYAAYLIIFFGFLYFLVKYVFPKF